MKLSIIIPVYNAEQTIARTIESVITEKSSDIELIIIDGNSTDNTMNVVLKYKYHINQVVSEPDEGYADAFNKGISIANGEFIMMLAADDRLLPGAIEKFKNSLNKDTEVWCGAVIQKMSYGFRLRKSDPNLNTLRTRCSLENAASFYRRRLFVDYGLFNTKYKCAADREIFLRLYLKNVNFQIEGVPIVVFEMGGLSTLNPEKYAIPEDEAISILYGLNPNEVEKASYLVRNVLRREKLREPLKRFFASIGILVHIYKLFGKSDGLLSKSRLRDYGVIECQ
jgi:glycosyltransferase involved in cell wall biosynthesis